MHEIPTFEHFLPPCMEGIEAEKNLQKRVRAHITWQIHVFVKHPKPRKHKRKDRTKCGPPRTRIVDGFVDRSIESRLESGIGNEYGIEPTTHTCINTQATFRKQKVIF